MKIINGIDKGLEKYILNPTNKPNKIIIHNTGGTDANILADTSHHGFELVKSFHKSKGWDTIGYHFFIEKDGDIYQGRPIEMHGSHCIGENKTSIGICMAGNFDATKPTEAQISSLKWLVADLSTKLSIKEIYGHRQFANKTCPGKNVTDDFIQSLIMKEKTLKDFSNQELIAELTRRLK